MAQFFLTPEQLKSKAKEQKKEEKLQSKALKAKDKKSQDTQAKPRLFVLEFVGDMKASNLGDFSKSVNLVLQEAQENDQVLLKIESPGGQVNSYGLAASHVQRLAEKVKLHVAVDKVAASGGYLMAAPAHKIIAAPFSIIGSIGVVAMIPNFNRLLKKNEIDIYLLTAGKYKRTVTSLGEVEEADKEKMKADLESIHSQFKKLCRQIPSSIKILTRLAQVNFGWEKNPWNLAWLTN